LLKKPPLLLASASPRRKEILEKFNYSFDICSHSFDEETLNFKSFKSPQRFVKELAKQKALSVNNTRKTIILAADTIVVLKNQLFGKPLDSQMAFNYLSQLQGTTHSVISAFCLLNTSNGSMILRSETSKVTFNCLTNDQINSYINNFNPYDKAGGYGIQDCPDNFINNYTGSLFNIMGLPIYLLNRVIKDSHQVWHWL